ncbi:MAG: ABC transporter ATP-binding protein [Burkholderiales bacterium]|nr:ABC transporter ATP-binding protein [Burkholderiales bacterium]
MSQPLLKVEDVSKHFGGFTALSHVSVEVTQGERLGLIGPNGSGKTTLINCISGMLKNDGGAVVFKGENLNGLAPHQRTRRGIARSFQVPRPFHSMTPVENLAIPLEYVTHRGKSGRADIRGEAESILAEMGLGAKMNVPCAGLSQVELRKLELARAMAARPSLLISDEAMAGLSNAECDEVLAILFSLSKTGITIIMIEHIMHAIMRFSERVICLDAGKLIAEGAPTDVVKNPEVQRAYLGA